MTDPKPTVDDVARSLAAISKAWTARFRAEMVKRGHPSFGEARGNLLRHISKFGTNQAEIAQKAGMTKQAVQQQIDLLVKDGAVARQDDPADKRKKRVVLTAKGLTAIAEAEKLKGELEAEVAEKLGPRGASWLHIILTKLTENPI